MLEHGKGLLTHTHLYMDGGPPTIFINKYLKMALNLAYSL